MKHVCQTFKGNAVHNFVSGLPRAVRDVQVEEPSEVPFMDTSTRMQVLIVSLLYWLANKSVTSL